MINISEFKFKDHTQWNKTKIDTMLWWLAPTHWSWLKKQLLTCKHVFSTSQKTRSRSCLNCWASVPQCPPNAPSLLGSLTPGGHQCVRGRLGCSKSPSAWDVARIKPTYTPAHKYKERLWELLPQDDILYMEMKLLVIWWPWLKSNILQIVHTFWASPKFWGWCIEAKSNLTTDFSGESWTSDFHSLFLLLFKIFPPTKSKISRMCWTHKISV